MNVKTTNILMLFSGLSILIAAFIIFLLYFTGDFYFKLNQEHIAIKFISFIITFFSGFCILQVFLSKFKYKKDNVTKEGIDLILSVVFTTMYFIFWNTNIAVDDAGFVIKHLENFSKGYFFSFNPEDGPIYGISGFWHNIIGGLFAYFHILSPINSLFVSNFLGATLVSYMLIKLIKAFLKPERYVYVLWAICLIASERYLIYLKQGLETPLHLGFILLSIYLFLKRDKHARWMWLIFVITIISKLDALVPLLGLSVIYLIEKRKYLFDVRNSKLKILKEILIYGILPITAWVAFTLIVFGSPLPQSFTAKMMIHKDTSSEFFPFIKPFIFGDYHFPINRWKLLVAGCILLFAIAIYLYRTHLKENKKKLLHLFLPLIFTILYILPYYRYNPYEKMGWYYVVPDFLVYFQFFLLIVYTIYKLEVNKIVRKLNILLLPGLLFFSLLLSSYSFIKIARPYSKDILKAETARIEVGKWINENSKKSDKLFTGFGNIAAYSKRYTIDYAGLNSRIVTELNNYDEIIKKTKPEWIVHPGVPYTRLKLDTVYFFSNYKLVNTNYNSIPVWRIYSKKNNATKEKLIDTNMILVDSNMINLTQVVQFRTLVANGKEIVIDLKDNQAEELNFGISKKDGGFILKAEVYDSSLNLQKEELWTIDGSEPANFINGYSQGIKLILPQIEGLTIKLFGLTSDGKNVRSIKLIEPILLGVK